MPPRPALPPQYFDETKKKGEVNELKQYKLFELYSANEL